MQKDQLDTTTEAVLARLVDGDEPIQDHYWGWQPDNLVRYLTKNVAFLAAYQGGVYSRERALKVIADIKAFYDNITDEEIALLNADTYECPCCGIDYTIDEFHTVESVPNATNIFHLNGRREGISVYCRHCTYKVPWQTTRNKPAPGYVYLAEWGNLHKIGGSQDPEKRMEILSREYKGIKLVTCKKVDNWRFAEAHLMTIFMHRHIEHELFNLTPEDAQHVARLVS